MTTIINQTTELVPLTKLTPHPANPRQGDTGAVAQSITQNGFYGTIVAQTSTGHILAGNHRYHAAKQLKLKKLPVVWVDVDDAAALRILLADNRTSDLATYNDATLAELLTTLTLTPEGLNGTGYDGDDLDELLNSLGVETPTPAEPTPSVPEEAQKKWNVQPGDVWRIGPHTLVCGDSTTPDAYQAAMGDVQADLVWTDPPYGVTYQADETIESLRKRNRRTDGLVVQNDALIPDNLKTFLTTAFTHTLNHTKPGAALYIAAPPGPLHAAFINALPPGILRQCLVWTKDVMVFGRSDYHYQHEMILYGWKPGNKHQWHGGRKQTSILNHPRPTNSDHHPTMKPLTLIEQTIRNNTRENQHILDPFSGSGSTIIAAHNTNRTTHAIELDPQYAAATLERCTQQTPHTPTRQTP